MTTNLTQAQIDEHNLTYNKAWKLIDGEIHLDGKQLPRPGWFSRRRLRKAKQLFEQTLLINPAGWNAMFAISKIEQRFGHDKECFDWLVKAREFAPDDTGVAKETCLAASKFGMHKIAAQIADEAIPRNPTDPALKVNSGLSHILDGNAALALIRFQEATQIEPSEINKKLHNYAERVLAGDLPKPHTESDIIQKVMRSA